MILVANSNAYPSNLIIPFIKKTWGKDKRVDIVYYQGGESKVSFNNNVLKLNVPSSAEKVNEKGLKAFDWIVKNKDFDKFRLKIKIPSKTTINDNSNNFIKNEYFLFNVMVFMFYWFSKVLITYSSLPSYLQEGNFFRISMEKLATIIAVFIFSLIISSVIKAFTKTSFFKILFWTFLCTILFQELAI